MKKPHFSLSVLLLVVVLAGCNGDGSSSDPTDVTPDPADVTSDPADVTPDQSPTPADLSVSLISEDSLVLPAQLDLQSVVENTSNPYTVAWTVDGPGNVYFSAPDQTRTSAEFMVPGDYTITASVETNGHTEEVEKQITVSRTPEFTAIFEGEFDIHLRANLGMGTRIVSVDGYIYVTFVDDQVFQKDGADYARTVVAQKKPGSDQWATTVVDDETRIDPHHGGPTIGVDGDGYLHVLYDMHGTPWQYQVSKKPHDISEWEFRGQDRDDWRNFGLADIPGNQVTYQHITSAPDGTLYLAYRECQKCEVGHFHKREWSGGLAQYSPQTRAWRRLGEPHFALGDADYRPQYIKTFLDFNENLHVGWVWGRQYTTEDGGAPYFGNPNYPSYAYSMDGGSSFYRSDDTSLALPLTRTTSEYVAHPKLLHPDLGFHSYGYFSAVDSISVDITDGDRPYVTTKGHYFHPLDSGGWLDQIDNDNKVPWTGKLFIDRDGNFIAVSGGTMDIDDTKMRGVYIHTSKNKGDSWHQGQFYFDRVNIADQTEPPAPDGYSFRSDRRYFLESNGQFRGFITQDNGKGDGLGVLRIWTFHLPAF